MASVVATTAELVLATRRAAAAPSTTTVEALMLTAALAARVSSVPVAALSTPHLPAAPQAPRPALAPAPALPVPPLPLLLSQALLSRPPAMAHVVPRRARAVSVTLEAPAVLSTTTAVTLMPIAALAASLSSAAARALHPAEAPLQAPLLARLPVLALLPPRHLPTPTLPATAPAVAPRGSTA